jgi:hypothetical protein
MKAALVFMIAFAFVLLYLDRQLRLGRELDANEVVFGPPSCPSGGLVEPFLAPVQTLNIPCGVDFPTCPNGSTCGNGWCIADVLNPLKENCPLPVLP